MKTNLFAALLISTLMTACGGGGGGGTTSLQAVDPGPGDVTNPSPNTAPVAHAGTTQSGKVGDLVTLDGTESSDADGHSLSYAWVFVTRPSGSTAALSDAQVAKPTFTPDVAGDYVVSLTVNDGALDSVPATVTVSATPAHVNAAPVANAGVDQNVPVGTMVTLDGTGSSDTDGDTLSYAWILQAPSGSTAVLSDALAARPTFTADLPGAYVATLTVHDGAASSPQDTVAITASDGNVAPVANAGPDRQVRIGTVVTLDGSASSDEDGDPLGYTWVFVSRPVGSAATLANADTVSPSFTPDVVGSYPVRLTVGDGNQQSIDTVTIEAVQASFDDAPALSSPPEPWEITGGARICAGYRVVDPTVINSNLVVPAGESCVLDAGVTVEGNIEVGAGAELFVKGALLKGNVEGTGASLVVIENSTLEGNVALSSGLEVLLRENVINGSVEASGHTGLVTVAGPQVVANDVVLQNNTGGVTVKDNSIDDELNCVGNVPAPTGGGNTAGRKLAQCELL